MISNHRYVVDTIVNECGKILYQRYIDKQSYPYAAKLICQDLASHLEMCFVRKDPGELDLEAWVQEPEPVPNTMDCGARSTVAIRQGRVRIPEVVFFVCFYVFFCFFGFFLIVFYIFWNFYCFENCAVSVDKLTTEMCVLKCLRWNWHLKRVFWNCTWNISHLEFSVHLEKTDLNKMCRPNKIQTTN